MKRKIISIITAVMMLAMIPVFSFGAENSESDDAVKVTQASLQAKGKYTGPAPVFPNAISQQAIKLACPYGTPNSKLTYPKAAAKKEYQEALQNAYGDRKGWSKQTRAGASCDVFAGTVIRSCGYDREFPRALAKDLNYLPASKKFKKVGITKASQFQPGDIIMYLNKGHGGHICVYVEIAGKGYIAEASYTYKRYGRIARRAPNWTPSSFASFGVYRPVNKCIGAIQRGDYSTGVKNLQMFLNWAGFDCGEADGDFGKKTEAAVKQFQESQNIEVDGKFGSGSYAAALKFTSGWPSTPQAATGANTKVTQPEKTTPSTAKGSYYTGSWPTKLIKYKKGSKTNIKRWQAFLKWKGYSIKVDGDFGKATRKITKQFQKANGLEADGIVGKDTIKKAKSIKK
ncbi:MAG: peptidoglycan-binding protein [Clostridia bacterium]|nr:peptidoglycan-binding protein [Clostridia bacterium]